METQTPVNSPGAAPVDWVSGLLNVIGGALDVVQTALQPGILAAQAYFQQLINARPELQDPLAQVNEQRRQTDTVLLYAGVGLIALLILVIVLRNRDGRT